jgi:hypothetical protein
MPVAQRLNERYYVQPDVMRMTNGRFSPTWEVFEGDTGNGTRVSSRQEFPAQDDFATEIEALQAAVHAAKRWVSSRR